MRVTFDEQLMLHETKVPIERAEGDHCVACGKYKGEWHMYPSGVCHRCYGEARGERLKKEQWVQRGKDKLVRERRELLEQQDRRKYKGKTREEHFAYETTMFQKLHLPRESLNYRQCDTCGMYREFPKMYRPRSKDFMYSTCSRCRDNISRRGIAERKKQRNAEREEHAVFAAKQAGLASIDSARREWKRLTKPSHDALERFNRRANRGYDIDRVKYGQRIHEADWHNELWALIKADRLEGKVLPVVAYFDKEMPRIKHGIPTIEELEAGRTDIRPA